MQGYNKTSLCHCVFIRTFQLLAKVVFVSYTGLIECHNNIMLDVENVQKICTKALSFEKVLHCQQNREAKVPEHDSYVCNMNLVGEK